MYAKQLVRLRQQKAKSMGLSSTITSTGHKMQVSQCWFQNIFDMVSGSVLESFDRLTWLNFSDHIVL